MSGKMYIFQVLVEPQSGKNHVQMSTEIAAKVEHMAAVSETSGINVSLIDNGGFPLSLVSKTRKTLEISIYTENALSREWLVGQIGTDGDTFKLVASKDPSLVYVE